jgi:hypothetical protein
LSDSEEVVIMRSATKRSDAMALHRRRWLLGLKLAVALGAVAGAGLVDVQNAATAQGRRPAPWCAALGGRDGGWDCGYYTFEQCMATARGLGGYCSPNPRVAFDPYRQPPPRKTRKQSYY